MSEMSASERSEKPMCVLLYITNLVTREWQYLCPYYAKQTYYKCISIAMLPILLLHI